MQLVRGFTSCSGSFGYFIVVLLVVLNILDLFILNRQHRIPSLYGSTGFRDLNKKAKKSEFTAWRGKAEIDYYDMVEIGNWVFQLTDRLPNAMKYYWVDNEVYYPFGAVVRAMYAIFSAVYGGKGLTTSFMNGMEIIVHYVLLKSNFIIGRKGGVRGTGTDASMLMAGIKPLQICYVGVTKKNFTAAVFPINKRRRKRHVHFHTHRRGARRFRSHRRKIRDAPDADTQHTENNLNVTGQDPELGPSPQDANSIIQDAIAVINQNYSSAEEHSNDTANFKGPLGRLMYTLNYGVQGSPMKTTIDIPDPEDDRMENIAVSIFWLIYEVMPSVCQFPAAERAAFKNAFEGVLGLVLSLYLYDQDDYGEEYERIFGIPINKFESEWIKIESITRQVQKTFKLNIRRPYSNNV